MPVFIFLLILFVEPAVVSLTTGTVYWIAWDDNYLYVFLIAMVVAVIEETVGFIRS